MAELMRPVITAPPLVVKDNPILEVRSFEGSPEELSEFVVGQWVASYRGKMAVPYWDGDYFRWQLRMDDPAFRRHLIAAYEGSRLAGVICHIPTEFMLAGERMRASQQSWLSVDPEFRRQGVGAAMIARSVEVHREWGARIKLGFTYYGKKASLGPKFWLNSQMRDSDLICNAGFWARVLDPKRAADWNLNKFESWLTRLATPLYPTLRPRANSKLVIRPAEQRDLARCLELVEESTKHCDLRLIWDPDLMSRQLGLKGFSYALVAEEQGQVKGFITYHILPMLGGIEAKVGIFDIVAVSQLSGSGRNELVDAALLDLKEKDAVLALKLRLGDYPTGLFTRLGWFFRPADSHVVTRWIHDPQPMPPLKKLHVLWR